MGRERELSELVTAYEDVEAGRGRLFLICGDPGIGKSRLADQFGTEVAARGARVLWGRCWEAGGAPAYWPWTQSLRSYVRDAELDRLRTEVGPGAPDLARVIPDLRTFVPDIPDPPASDPEAARFRLFDSVAAFLWNASRSGPLVIVIDDLHAADAPSLLLLRFLASELGRARVLIIGSYRDTEIAHNSTLAETVSELTREPSVRRMQLAGLTESAVAELIAKTAGLSPPAKLVTAVHSETGGNPLFVGEIVRLLATEGRLDHAENLPRLLIAVPEEISATIGRRLDHLSRGCVETLMLASVLGREFDLKVLEVLTGSPSIELLKILEEAVTARVVSDVPGSPGRSRFAHALIRDTLYDRIPGARRANLHAKVGDALERLHQDDLEQHLAEIAGHFFEAAPAGDAERALAYAERAATSAVKRL
ncbi:MAG: ATP-binding protein, partial [Actinomycetota bacterium]